MVKTGAEGRVLTPAGSLPQASILPSTMDLRLAFRSLLRSPWYSATAAGTIALGVALATTVFALVDAALLRPLPFARAQELYHVNGPFSVAKSMNEIREWAAAVPNVPLAAYRGSYAIGSTPDLPPVSIRAARVGPNFLDVLGQQPIAGGLQPDDFVVSSGPVRALISYGLWQRMFGGSWSALGQKFSVPGSPDSARGGYIVAGILPRDLMFPDQAETPDLVLPFQLTPAQEANRTETGAFVLARVPAGMDLAALKTRIDAVAMTQGFRDVNADLRGPGSPNPQPGVTITSVADLKSMAGTAQYRSAFVAALVLVVAACTNVVALAIGRSRQRRRDYLVQRALGASRWRLTRAVTIEALPLLVVGTAIGLAITPWLIRTAVALMDARATVASLPPVGTRALAFAAIINLFFLVTLVLAQGRTIGVRASSMAIGRDNTATGRRGWVPSVLMGTQIALAFVLTVGGALVIGSLWWAWRQDPGFAPTRAFVVDLSLGTGSLDDRRARFETVVDRLHSTPGVREIGVVSGPILRKAWGSAAIERPQGALPGREQGISVGANAFSILGIERTAGRSFTDDEYASMAPVVMVSERVARTFWPGQNALGQVIQSRSADRKLLTVIGVVRDARLSGPDYDGHGQIYRSVPWGGTLLIRSDVSTIAKLADLVGVIRQADPQIAVTLASTVEREFGEPIRQRTFAAWLYGAFATSGLAIVAVGLFGLVAMGTAARTREIGIRGALGATRGVIVRMVLREQLLTVAGGLLIGGLASWWAASFLRRSMFGFGVHDARLWTIAALTIVLVAIAAALVPAWKASRTSPTVALRAE